MAHRRKPRSHVVWKLESTLSSPPLVPSFTHPYSRSWTFISRGNNKVRYIMGSPKQDFAPRHAETPEENLWQRLRAVIFPPFFVVALISCVSVNWLWKEVFLS